MSSEETTDIQVVEELGSFESTHRTWVEEKFTELENFFQEKTIERESQIKAETMGLELKDLICQAISLTADSYVLGSIQEVSKTGFISSESSWLLIRSAVVAAVGKTIGMIVINETKKDD